jgi:hypothetical protein
MASLLANFIVPGPFKTFESRVLFGEVIVNLPTFSTELHSSSRSLLFSISATLVFNLALDAVPEFSKVTFGLFLILLFTRLVECSLFTAVLLVDFLRGLKLRAE